MELTGLISGFDKMKRGLVMHLGSALIFANAPLLQYHVLFILTLPLLGLGLSSAECFM